MIIDISIYRYNIDCFNQMLGTFKITHIFSGTNKVRNSGLGPDPDQSAKNGPEKVRNWALGPDFFWGMPLVCLNRLVGSEKAEAANEKSTNNSLAQFIR